MEMLSTIGSKSAVVDGRQAALDSLDTGKKSLAKGEYKNAVACLSQSIEEDPKCEAHFYRGQCYLAMGKHQDALNDLDKAIEMRKGSTSRNDRLIVEIMGYRAEALLHLSEPDKAKIEIEEAVQAAHLIGDSVLEQKIGEIRRRIVGDLGAKATMKWDIEYERTKALDIINDSMPYTVSA